MIINGKQFDFNINKADYAERYKTALHKMIAAGEDAKKKIAAGEISEVSATIETYREFLHDATGVYLIDETEDDVITAEGIYYDFLEQVAEQREEREKLRRERLAKYKRMKEKV